MQVDNRHFNLQEEVAFEEEFSEFAAPSLRI